MALLGPCHATPLRLLYIQFVSAEFKLEGEFEVKREAGKCLATKGGRCALTGVTWLENKIYVICHDSNRVHVYSDEEPSKELKEEGIQIEGMIRPIDVAASRSSRSIFIVDDLSWGIWEVRIAGKVIRRLDLEGRPTLMSITSTNEILVAVQHEGLQEKRWNLNIYRSSNLTLSQSIPLPAGMAVKQVTHAVQLSNGNFILALVNNTSPHGGSYYHPDTDAIVEMSKDGNKFERVLDPCVLFPWCTMQTEISHLSIDEDDNIFAADIRRNRVIVLNSRLSEYRSIVHVAGPGRLCYVKEKQQLIVGSQWTPDFTVSAYNLHP